MLKFNYPNILSLWHIFGGSRHLVSDMDVSAAGYIPFILEVISGCQYGHMIHINHMKIIITMLDASSLNAFTLNSKDIYISIALHINWFILNLMCVYLATICRLTKLEGDKG